MILSGVQCETCKQQHVTEQRPWHEDMPEGWLTLTPGNPQLVKPWHFCSRNCLIQWLRDQSLQEGKE